MGHTLELLKSCESAVRRREAERARTSRTVAAQREALEKWLASLAGCEEAERGAVAARNVAFDDHSRSVEEDSKVEEPKEQGGKPAAGAAAKSSGVRKVAWRGRNGPRRRGRHLGACQAQVR